MSMYVYDWSGSACLTDYARISQTRPLTSVGVSSFPSSHFCPDGNLTCSGIWRRCSGYSAVCVWNKIPEKWKL